ncbi:hypothetical protein [Brevundimonas diminuta]|uniref:hypothetical protein n=1 Tax=Brevundimonas diminuta TaxID=293 RepID=UPI003D9AB022
MTDALAPLSNELPDALAAVLVHRVHVALTAEQKAKAARRVAERQAEAAGVPVGGLRRARRMMTADPDRLERQAQEEALILKVTRAAVQVEQPSLFEQTTDQSDEARDQRLHDEGYSAAVWCAPRDGGGYEHEADVAAWSGGYDAFTADLAAFEQSEQNKRERA